MFFFIFNEKVCLNYKIENYMFNLVNTLRILGFSRVYLPFKTTTKYLKF